MSSENGVKKYFERDPASWPVHALEHRALRRYGPERRPYYVTDLEAQLLSYAGSVEVQNSILAAFEQGEAYVEEG